MFNIAPAGVKPDKLYVEGSKNTNTKTLPIARIQAIKEENQDTIPEWLNVEVPNSGIQYAPPLKYKNTRQPLLGSTALFLGHLYIVMDCLSLFRHGLLEPRRVSGKQK